MSGSERANPHVTTSIARDAYDAARYDFAGTIRKCLREGGFVAAEDFALKDLHTVLDAHDEKFINTKDFTRLTPYFFDIFEKGHPIAELYRRFLEEFVKPLLGERCLVYQKMPAVRFIFPDQPSLIPQRDELGSFHADYLNAHPLQEVNFWMPLTPCWDSNSLQILEAEDSEEVLGRFEADWIADHGKPYLESLFEQDKHISIYRLLGSEAGRRARSLVGDVGDVFRFTPRHVHGTLYNRTGSTRVSMDFRVMRESDYRELGGEARNLDGKYRYKVGDLYEIC